MKATDPALPGDKNPILKKTAATLALAAVCILISWGWTLSQASQSMRLLSETLTPFLLEHLQEGDAPLPYPGNGVSVTLLQPDGSPIASTGTPAIQRPYPLEDSSRQRVYRRSGKLHMLFPLQRSRLDIAGYAVISRPLSPLNGLMFQRSLLLMFLLGSVLVVLSHFRRNLIRPRDELMEEIHRLRSDSIDGKISLSLNNPFKPVADTVNRLVTTRERQSRVLTEQHHHQQILLNNMSEGIVVLDNDLRISGVNPAAAHWLGLGNPLRAQGEVFYTLCRHPKLLSLIEGLTSSETLKEDYLRLDREGGGDRIVKVKGSPLIDKDQTLGVLILLQDVTTLRRLETLRQDFVANVTHELRTPLTSIKGYTELILDEPDLTGTSRNQLEKILNQSTRMIHIIEDLLSLTRIEGAKQRPGLQVSELQPILEKAVQLCEEPAGMRGLTLHLECEPGIQAEVHPPLFEQAIHNLLHNAVKYTYPNTDVFLRARHVNHRIRIEITDHGPGIPQADQPRIFERFYRVDKARSRAIGGTGLGLSIVKHIAMLHQAECGVESRPNHGSTFWLSLPTADKKDSNGIDAQSAATASSSSGNNPSR